MACNMRRRTADIGCETGARRTRLIVSHLSRRDAHALLQIRGKSGLTR